MSLKKPANQSHPSIFRRAGKIMLGILLGLLILLLLVVLLLQTSYVQNLARKKTEAWLNTKLKTKIRIGKLHIGFPHTIELGDIYIEDLQKDTLLLGQSLKIDINMWKLLHKDIAVSTLSLDGITAKIKRQLPDTSFNFQFIADAFAPKTKQTSVKKDSSTLKIALSNLLLHRIRLVYNDVVTGSDMEAWIEQSHTRFDTLDPGHMQFAISLLEIKGVQARVYQNKPLHTPDENLALSGGKKDTAALQLSLKKINLQNIAFDYKNNISALYSNIQLGELKGAVRRFDLKQQLVTVDELALNKTNAIVAVGRHETAKVLNKKAAVIVDSAKAGWRFQVTRIALHDNNIQYDDESRPRLKDRVDFSHLQARQLHFTADNLLYSMDSIAASITSGSLQEQSGFTLNRFAANFLYAPHQAYLKNMNIQTPGTRIRRSVVLSYSSPEALQKHPSAIAVDADLYDTRIHLKDVLLLAPALRTQPLFKNRDAIINLDSRVQGTLARLSVPAFRFSGIGNTSIDVYGTIQNAADIKKLQANLSIQHITSTARDIQALLPLKTIPASIHLPEHFTLRGKINGGVNAVTTDLILQSALGNAGIKGNAARFTDKRNAVYNMTLVLDKLNLGTLLGDSLLGPVTATIAARGKGYDPQYANARLKGTIAAAIYKHYNYRNLSMEGNIAAKQLQAIATMRDPNISFAMNARANFISTYPALQFNLHIDTLRTLPLHLTQDTVFYQGNLAGDFASTTPDDLQGKLLATHSVLIKNSLQVPMDTIQLTAGKTDSGRFVRLHSDMLQLQLYGQYRLSQMSAVLDQAMEPYFSTVADSDFVPTDPYRFTIAGTLINSPLLKVLAPGLDSLKPVTFQSHFRSDSGWNARIQVPLMIYGSNRINNLDLIAYTRQDKLFADLSLAHIKSGSSLNVYATSVTASIAQNKIDFLLVNKDRAGKNKYRLAGLFQQPNKGAYELSLKPDSLMLNYDAWHINSDNRIAYANKNIYINRFELGKGSQLLTINSNSTASGAPIDVSFRDFRLSTLSAFAKEDSLLVDGLLEGKTRISDIMTQPVFTSDLTINNLAVYADTLGDLRLNISETTAKAFAADIRLTGRGNDVQLTGNYNVLPVNSHFSLKADIRQLQLKSLEGATRNKIRDASGSLNGGFDIAGTWDKPVVNGELNFNKARFNLSALNNYFNANQQKITITADGMHLNNFTIEDSAGNKAIINGMAATTDFTHYKFNLALQARNFQALNSTRKNNKLYYGRLFFSTNLTLTGSEQAPRVDGSLTVNDKTNLTIVLPEKEPGIEERESIVKFTSASAPPTDFVMVNANDTLNNAGPVGMDLSVNIEIKKEAELNIIIDEGNGDFLNVKGEALLNAGIDQSGKITLTGSYELESGAYELTFNFLKKKFNIQKGSKIVWKGEPTDASVDVTGVYLVNAAPLDLVQNQLEGSTTAVRNTYLQKLPFEVDLRMQGQLLRPLITFNILLPDNKNYSVSKNIIELVNQKLTDLRKEPSELNKQVFALLLLNRFVQENPFQSSGEGLTAESFARASVSKLLTEQLNRLATDLVKGVDINFDVVSQDDYSTGIRQNQTDLNVALSKRLLNDRLTVTVGSNFELEGAQNTRRQSSNIAGNVAVDYNLSKDGRYLLRAYRKNDYTGIIEGYIIETGIGFILSVDYDQFKEIFQSQKTKDRIRAERRAERERQSATPKNDVKTGSR